MSCDLALIGFGEAGETFAAAGNWDGKAIGVDLLPDRRAAMKRAGIIPVESDALRSASLSLSLVTADQALRAAQSYADHLGPGTLWCDGNSVAPETKRAAAAHINVTGARYIDMAILAPVQPKRMAVPMLLSGDAAHEAAARLRDLGFSDVRVVGSQVGQASAIKMIRSVMVKGIEALTAEMMLAAAAAGVVEEVLASLDASESDKPWAERAEYNLERMTTHGLRRAAEMEQSAQTLLTLGVEPHMTRGTIKRQREMAKQSSPRSVAA